MLGAPDNDPLLTFDGVRVADFEEYSIDELLRVLMWRTVLEYQKAHLPHLSPEEIAKLKLAMDYPSDELWEMVIEVHAWFGARLEEHAIRLSNYQMGYGAVAPGYDDGDDQEEQEVA